MPDITQPETMPTVQRRLEGQSQGREAAARAAAEEGWPRPIRRSRVLSRWTTASPSLASPPPPVEQITPVTQAALAGLVAEINHLRNVVKRHERSAEKRSSGQAQQPEAAVLEPEAFLRMLGGTLGQSPGEGNTWIIVLVHVATYEDIRRSSGLLAANSALAEVAHRLKDARISTATGQPALSVESAAAPASVTPSVAALEPAAVPFVLLGYAGGSNIAGVTAVTISDIDTAVVAKSVRTHLSASGYGVGGIDMALDMTIAAAAVGSGESALLALGRVDHQLRTKWRRGKLHDERFEPVGRGYNCLEGGEEQSLLPL